MYFWCDVVRWNCLNLYLVGNPILSMMDGFPLLKMVCVYCFFSYSTLLELHYGGRVTRSLNILGAGKEMGTSVRESECRMDVGLFLNEYPGGSWELHTDWWSYMKCFYTLPNRGQKEVDCMVCQGHQGSAKGPDPGVGQLPWSWWGHQTSCKEIWGVYQSVYLLWRLPGIPCCGEQIRKRTIRDILSSLKDQIHRCGEDLEPQEEWWHKPKRWEPYEEALREALPKGIAHCWRHFKLVLKDWVKETGVGHEPTPRPAAKATVEVA